MFQITFKIQKQVKFGQGVFVIGNLPEIGSWIVAQGFRLNWNQDHIWQGTVTFDAKTLKKLRRIQYKYIIASWQNPQNQSIQWEIGQQNRLIDVNFLENQSKICDQWNMSKLKIHLITKKPLKDQNSLKYRYSMIGNCTQLGNWKIRKGLRLQQNLHSKIIRKLSENIPKTDILKFLKNQLIFDVYFTQLTIPRDQNKFSYYFVRQNDKIQIERHPGRVYSFNVEKYPHRNSIIYEPGFTGIYDEQNFDKPTLSKITPQIYLGSYLKTEKDLQYLKNLGIQAIYSIQTEQDHEDNGISPLYLELLCKQYEIILKKIQIQDRNSRDFVQKSKTAVQEIDQLVRMGKPTYVYCSAGKYRSPQMVALYLTLKNGLNVSDAIKFIQDRHPVARPNEKTIKTAIYHITHFNLGSPVKQTVENRAN